MTFNARFCYKLYFLGYVLQHNLSTRQDSQQTINLKEIDDFYSSNVYTTRS